MFEGCDDHGPPPAVYDRWGGERAPSPAAPVSGRVDVAIVGGGITGLSSACHLRQRGATVAVLEAKDIGWGASGRAFGQIVPTLTHGTGKILAHFGRDRGEALIAGIATGPDVVFDLIRRHAIDCGAIRTGILFAARTLSGMRRLEGYAVDWRDRGAAIDLLDRTAAASAIGSDLYGGAIIDRRGGHLNPLAYTRGLARAVCEGGGQVHVGAPVAGLERQGTAWHLRVPGGSVVADTVILATNAYTGKLWPDIARSIVPMRVHAAATSPMAEEALARVLPEAHPLTDTRRLYSGVRRIDGNRLHVTVDGPAFGRHAPPFMATADRRLRLLFPGLSRVAWEESWNGWIALTRERMPRLHALGPGLYAGFGYSGRGLAAATLMGRDLANVASGADVRDLTFPVTGVAPIRGRRLAPLGISAMIQGWRVLDRLDEGRPRQTE